MSCVGGAEITLLVDETKLHDRIGVMLVGVAWQGRCLPLAWRTYRANSEAAYPAEGQVGMIRALLQAVKAGIGDLASVLVLADRGIGCSPALCRVVEALGWRYLFRVTCQTKIVTEDADYRIARQVQPGEVWRQAGRVFKQRGRIEAHARALWGVGYDEPWALVTNDERLTGYEYARRNWQEQSFRDLKSGGWHWGDSRLRSPTTSRTCSSSWPLPTLGWSRSAVKRSRQVAPNPWSVAPTVLSGACGVSFGKDCVTSRKSFNGIPCVWALPLSQTHGSLENVSSPQPLAWEWGWG
ncbi:MAG: hypothetical protein IPK17_00835 [Chloroflexi bacterium]|uniref:hypothetical protein n=1 Tax=Candidatus Flexifilum breve TaxID=3140694 RepID=UPI003135084D|nr:hypothetical protein [Chloroflexota bacterium]